MRDGLTIAFYPVLGEVVFFYLMYQDIQHQLENEEHEVAAASESPSEEA